MPEDFGNHLLGRIPSPDDDRDFKLSSFMGKMKESPLDLDQALKILTDAKGVAKATKDWATFITRYLKNQSPATPTPPVDFVWPNKQAPLDQGNTGHCVGFGWCQWGNTAPVEDEFANDDGHAVYYECKTIDGEPKSEDGSYVRSGAKAMKNRNKVEAYAFADDINVIVEWVKTKGPLTVGTDWMTGMFKPDDAGHVIGSGKVEGGHCYLLAGIAGDDFVFLNSWGDSFGHHGYFSMAISEWANLYSTNGEACTAVELG
jgi:hypothetical protein